MPSVTASQDGTVEYSIEAPLKGVWTYASALSPPSGMAPDLTNCILDGDTVRHQLGNAQFITTAWPNDTGTINLIADRRIAGSEPVMVIATTAGIVYYWTGAAWTILRQGLSTTSTLWWAATQYGTDLFITNPTDGVYRYDGDTLVPIGAKPIAQMESDEAALWAGETTDTTNYREGTQGMYVESSGAQTTMTFTPASNFDAATGRLSAAAYASDKSPGTDFYHFKVFFTNTGTIDTTNTRVLLTDGSAVTLNFPYTTWDSDRDGTAMPSPPVASTWYDVYLPCLDGTDSGTFNSANIDTFAFAVDTSAGTLRMSCDDFYVIYNDTMPAVQVLAEWKNILFGGYTTANPDSLHWSKVRAPDEYSTTATAPVKAGGDAVTALKPFFHQLTIGTTHHVLTLSGSIIGQTYPAYLFDINEVTDECGIGSHRSTVKANNKLYWYYSRRFWAYNGTSVQDISNPVATTVDGIVESAAAFVVGERFLSEGEVWWSYRRSGQSTNDRVLRWNFGYEAWLPSLRTTPVIYRTYESGVERLLIADNTNRFIYEEQDATPGYQNFGSDNVSTIELAAVGDPAHALEWEEAFLAYLSNTGSITPAYRVADHLRALSGTSYTSLTAINQAIAGELGRIRAGYVGKVCQWRLTATGVAFQLQFPLVIRGVQVGDDRAFP